MLKKNMDIYHYLTNDHRKVARLFKQIIASTSEKKRKQLFLQVHEELELHADPEQQTFYAALKKHNLQEDAQHGAEEHHEIKDALKKLSKIRNPSRVKWLVQFGELKRIVEHHVEDEEGKMFSDAKKTFSNSEAIELAQQMDQLKQEMKKSKKFLSTFKVAKKPKNS